jgi:integrase
VLRTALKTAIRLRLIAVNIATLIDAPLTVGREIQPLTTDRARALLIAGREHPLDAFVTVALGCGLRLGEALGLQWADVDLDSGTLQVKRAVTTIRRGCGSPSAASGSPQAVTGGHEGVGRRS